MTIRSKAIHASVFSCACALLCAASMVWGNAVAAQETTAPGASEGDPIAAAREAVASSPDDAKARLGLAQALGQAMRKDPALGIEYAGEMLNSLQKAIELDPTLTDAYPWLAGYYLNAPPIAGGSVVEAEKIARRLIEIDPERGAALLKTIEDRKNSGDQGQH